jgi:acetolactate synthase I/II/III large subunit
VLLRVKVDSSWRVAPQVRFGRPNEDMEPLLPREIFEKLMIVPPMAASMEIDE